MCGIFGFSRPTETTLSMASFLAWDMEDRGKDSWGCTNGPNLIRRMGPITKSWEVPEWVEFSPTPITYHTRAASQGAVNLQNCHPFEFDGRAGVVVGVHNGCLSNHLTLNNTHSRQFSCDSMHIFAHLAEGRKLEEIYGWGAVVWFQQAPNSQTYDLNFLRFGKSDLYIGELESGEVVWASTERAIKKACRMVHATLDRVYLLPSEYKYTLRSDQEVVADYLERVEEMKVGTYTTTYNNPNWSGVAGGQWNGHRHHAHIDPNPNSSNTCIFCRIHSIPSNEILCGGCLDEFWEEYKLAANLPLGAKPPYPTNPSIVKAAGGYAAPFVKA